MNSSLRNNRHSLDLWDLFSMDSVEYIGWHIYLMIMSFIYYNNLLFVTLDGLSSSQSKWILIICILSTSVFGIILRWDKFMTIRGLCADIACGLGIYTILAYKAYYPVWIAIICAACLLFFIINTVYIFTRRIRGQLITKIKNKKRKKSIIKRRIFITLNSSGLILGLLMVVLMTPVAYRRIIHGGILVAESNNFKAEGFDNDYEEDKNGLAANIDSISMIRFSSQWDLLTVQDKLNVLQDICNCEANYWGMQYQVRVVMDDLDELIIGCYDNSSRTIHIDWEYLKYEESEYMLNAILHEMYHAWEYNLIDLYLNSSDSQKKLRIFRHCEEYMKEISHYEEAGTDDESYMKYYCQYLEADSREYAEQAVEEYYQQIDSILEEENKDIPGV